MLYKKSLKNNVSFFIVAALISSILLHFMVMGNVAGHKFLDTPTDNTSFENALSIPNHTVSWGIYQKLGGDVGDARFYEFKNDLINNSFYAHLSTPQIQKYSTFTPSLAIFEPKLNNDTVTFDTIPGNYSEDKSINFPFDIPQNYKILLKANYEGPMPSSIYYEPFTQTSYWERQEIRTHLQKLGTYFIVVFNEKNDSELVGKFVLAVGEVEDFSLQDFFTLLPYSWIKVKLFFEDYVSLMAIILIILILIIVSFLLVKKKIKK